MICAIMIGRATSTGFPGKNTYPVLGRALSEYPLLAAKHSRHVDKVFLSTDDQAIMAIGRAYGAAIIERPAYLATKEALGEDAYIHALKVIREKYLAEDEELELLVLLMCNAATITSEIIDQGIEALRSNPGYDSAVTVSCYNMWSPLRARKIGKDGLLHPFVPFETFGDSTTLNCDRDSQGDVWFADMDVSIVRPANLDNIHNGLLPQKWMGQNIYPLKQWGAGDIDYEWQLPGVIFRLQKLGFSEITTPYDNLKVSPSKVIAEPNANFTRLDGDSVHTSQDPRYLEYRRRWMGNPRKFIVDDFPIHLDIETTNRCNLKCTFCDKLPYLKPEDFGFLDFDLFARIIDEGAEKKLCGLKLSYRGEPLLHPRLAEMVGYAKRKGVLDVYFNTNAMLLSEAKARALLDAGLNRISVSVEGTDPSAYERERVGARFDLVKKNLERLLNLRSQSGMDYPKIRLQTVALQGIDLKEYARYWSAYSDETAAIDYKEANGRDTSIVAVDWACPQLWQRMTIEWDGRIMACNNDDYRFLSPGNVAESSVSACWQAPLVQNARKLHMQGRSHELESCNGCPWRTTQVMKKRAITTEIKNEIGSF